MAEIKNIKKAAARIKQAIKKKERIILYGDADMDGVTSVILLKESIQNLGGQVADIYFPDREIEGYGLNKEALETLKAESPALLILLDCGIGNFIEVKAAKKMGFEVMIVDHHKTLGKLPVASIIVNPRQDGDKYPFKEFAAAGVVFRLIETMLAEKMTSQLRDNFLELTALATIADMMPQTEDNILFIGEGLASLEKTVRPGLLVFWQIDSVVKGNIRQLVQKIISAAHAGGNRGHLNEAYLLLTSTSTEKAKELVEYLIDRSYQRQSQIKEIVNEIEKMVLRKMKEPIIFEGGKTWPVLMLGPAASKICHTYQKPVFLYNFRNGVCQGAVRTPAGLDGVKAMMHCSEMLETYGGHPQAAGFRIKEKDLDKFKTCLTDYFKK